MSKNITLDTYNKSASELAGYFKGIGSRIEDIDLALKLADKSDGSASVLEIGCGDGRDAEEILKRVKNYKGIDYSEELIKIARKKTAGANLVVSDLLNYEYEKSEYDVILAFASLLHISKEQFIELVPKLAGALKPGGIFFVSLKYREDYEKEWKEDDFGKRLFYFYNPQLVEDMCRDYFEVLKVSNSRIGKTKWFELAMKKK